MKLRGRRRTKTVIAHSSATSQAAAKAPLQPLSPPPTSFHSLPSTQPHQPANYPPSLSVATCRESNILQLSLSQLSRFSLFFIKLPKRKSEVGWTVAAPTLPTQLSYSTITWRRPARPPPLLLHPIGWSRLLSGSNGILSAAIGAIGKQRPKMNYPVSSPSLMNK